MYSKSSLIIMLTLGLIFCCSNTEHKTPVEKTIVLKAQQGKTVFELLQARHDIEYSQSSRGVFIKSIDGIENQGGHFWTYYINGKPGQVACDKYKVAKGDRIEWRYE